MKQGNHSGFQCEVVVAVIQAVDSGSCAGPLVLMGVSTHANVIIP